MPSFLTRQRETAAGEHAVTAVYTLVLAAGVYLVALGRPTVAAGAGLLVACAMWNRARFRAMTVRSDEFRCGVNAAGAEVMHLACWVVGWTLGPCMAALGAITPVRISGLVILGAGLSAEWTCHYCRFSSRCRRKRPWEDAEDPLL